MESIVEQIAREVMVKMKSDSANRGSSYTPPPTSTNPVTPASGTTAVMLTANFKVIDQVIDQVNSLVPPGGKLIVSSYLYDNYGQEKIGGSVNLIHSKNIPSHRALEGVGQLVIPSFSVNTMSKAANLIADTYATRVLCHALGDGIPIRVTDPAILEASRYYPAGVAKKIDQLRRELESMGVTFGRSGMNVTPSPKCTTSTCTPAPISAPQSSYNSNLDCTSDYGSCVTHCAQKVQDVVKAGAQRVEKGLDAPVPSNEMARYIDHTLLKANVTKAEITKLCDEAKQYSFASVCVNPANVAQAAKLLEGSPVKVCTVIGFPLGATSTFAKAMETRDAVANGADEIDMVINVGALKSKDYELVKNDIARVVEAANGNIVKVILETSLLNDEEKVKACELSKLAGADFVKTSTGFSSGGATLEDVCLMRSTVGPHMGVKASGGVRDNETAQQMIQLGATRIGASASVAIVKNEKSSGGSGY